MSSNKQLFSSLYARKYVSAHSAEVKVCFLKFRKDPVEPQAPIRGFAIDKTDQNTNYAKLPSAKWLFLFW